MIVDFEEKLENFRLGL